jgi:hypothetical protein
LKTSQRSQLSVGFDDPLHRGGTQGADQLVLQVPDACIEAQSFHAGATEVGPEPDPLEAASKITLFGGVIEARKPDIQALRAELIEEGLDVLGTSDGHYRNTLGVKPSTTTFGQGLERELVADSFHKHYRTN